MYITSATHKVQEAQGDALIVGAARQQKAAKGERTLLLSPAAQVVNTSLNGLLDELATNGEFKGQLGEIVTVYSMGKLAVQRVILVGLGALETLNTQAIRRASAIAARHLQNTGAHQITFDLHWHHNIDEAQGVQAQVEGALLGLYTFRHYQSSADHENAKGVTHIKVLQEGLQQLDSAEVEQAIYHGRVLAEATNFARDLVNEPANVLTPQELAHRASTMAGQSGLECEVFDKARIAALRMGGLLGVSKGSAEPPQFIVLRYRGSARSTEKGLGLVGKGITFDSGGISIKPAERMDEMKGDMGGAAAVIGAMQAIAALKPSINVTALVPTCENMPSSTAYRPGDILRIMNGKTIEIINTDAEGRLVLADALSYAVQEGLSPIIDLATLTGGVVVALGTTMAGLFSNDELLTDEIIAAGRIAGEKFWPMPMDEEYGEQIKSEIADIKQTGGRAASSVTAAKILEQFVGDTRWAHLDIAGTSYSDSKKPYQEKGATGIGVRTLTELALRLAH